MKATDFNGKPLKKGDIVNFMEVGYRNLMVGTITSLSKKRATISHTPDTSGRTETIQYHHQLIKLET